MKGLCRRHGLSEAPYCWWCSKVCGMSLPQTKPLKRRDAENVCFEKLPSEQFLENGVIKDALQKEWRAYIRAGAHVRNLMERGSTEPRAMVAVRMSASALRSARALIAISNCASGSWRWHGDASSRATV